MDQLLSKQDLLSFISVRSISERVAAIAFACLPMAMFLGPFPTDLFIALIIIPFLCVSLRESDWSWTKAGWFKCFLSFWLFMILSSFWSLDPLDSFGHALSIGRYGLVSAAIGYWLYPDKQIRQIFFTGLLYAVSFIIVDGLIQYSFGYDLFGKPHFHEARLTGPLNRPRLGLTMAWLGVPLLAVALVRFEKSNVISKKISWLLLGFGVLVIGVISGDRGGLLEMLTSCFLIGCFLSTYRRLMVKLTALLLCLVSVVFIITPETFDRQIVSSIEKIKHFPESDYGVVYRGGLRTFLDHPWVGVGVRQYRDVCHQHHHDLRMATTPGGSSYRLINEDYACGHHPHNLYLELLAESGSIGLGLFCSMLIGLFYALWQSRQELIKHPFVVGCLAVLLSRLFPLYPAGSFYVVWGVIPIWLMIGILLGALRVFAKPSPSEGLS